jgi:hypothetical protein
MPGVQPLPLTEMTRVLMVDHDRQEAEQLARLRTGCASATQRGAPPRRTPPTKRPLACRAARQMPASYRAHAALQASTNRCAASRSCEARLEAGVPSASGSPWIRAVCSAERNSPGNSGSVANSNAAMRAARGFKAIASPVSGPTCVGAFSNRPPRWQVGRGTARRWRKLVTSLEWGAEAPGKLPFGGGNSHSHGDAPGASTGEPPCT